METTVKLYTWEGKFVAEITCMRYKFWPMGFAWGERQFVRRDWETNPGCQQDNAPDYYECSIFPIVPPFGQIVK